MFFTVIFGLDGLNQEQAERYAALLCRNPFLPLGGGISLRSLCRLEESGDSCSATAMLQADRRRQVHYIFSWKPNLNYLPVSVKCISLCPFYAMFYGPTPPVSCVHLSE